MTKAKKKKFFHKFSVNFPVCDENLFKAKNIILFNLEKSSFVFALLFQKSIGSDSNSGRWLRLVLGGRIYSAHTHTKFKFEDQFKHKRMRKTAFKQPVTICT